MGTPNPRKRKVPPPVEVAPPEPGAVTMSSPTQPAAPGLPAGSPPLSATRSPSRRARKPSSLLMDYVRTMTPFGDSALGKDQNSTSALLKLALAGDPARAAPQPRTPGTPRQPATPRPRGSPAADSTRPAASKRHPAASPPSTPTRRGAAEGPEVLGSSAGSDVPVSLTPAVSLCRWVPPPQGRRRLMSSRRAGECVDARARAH
jgi:hypothetical protein